MTVRKALAGAIAALAAAGVWGAAVIGHNVRAQEGAPVEQTSGELAAQKAAQEAASSAGPQDPYQKSMEIFTYRTSAKAGPGRGEELYYIKCWFCHNQYARTGPALAELLGDIADMGPSAAQKLDAVIVQKIKKGSEKMPAYGSTLKDEDIADLLAYIKSGKCCFDAENPPPNPRYIAGAKTGGQK